MRIWRSAWAIWFGVLAAACATARPSVHGRVVEVEQTKGGRGEPVAGELIAVGTNQMWVAGPARTVRSVSRTEVQEVRVRQHGLTGTKVAAWVILGALVSGAALSLSCSSVEGSECGRVFLPVLLTWGVLGVPAAVGFARTSQLHVKPSDWETLRPFARFPQGIPEGLDPATLGSGSGSNSGNLAASDP